MIGTYKNGNYTVMIFENGTKVRYIKAGSYEPAFAENIDLKITDKCNKGCPFCHEGSTPQGRHADILNETFINTLHPCQELAIGGGNILEHPDLEVFLRKLKDKKVIANITINQSHFMENLHWIRQMEQEGLFHGLGVSLINPDESFLKEISNFTNGVVHTINGINPLSDYQRLADRGLKVLVLGYKNLRRGEEYLKEKNNAILINQKNLYYSLPDLIHRFEVLSFDNLAIEQLEVRRMLAKEEWDRFYMGDDGKFTFYIDAVTKVFARSSATLKRYPLTDDVDEMFREVRKTE